ncbi:hypothetical protein [Pseudoalteromonas aurantia]|uniref:Uncharacterized protein n=1 Tax=Pseudoalteromonas aurantia 208 TaxID=1314867 RepID=A0ABR9E983_9GAMM|nr:hypothetical protein [Pseudoalteromonas aurantia]MBE0367538.1 hypothetical protein [Pseudoalteromonas aurantia 208]
MDKVLTKLLTCSLVISVAGGCSSTTGLIASFEDLTTETSKEGFTKIPQYRVISIPGMLPFSDIGGVHFYKSQRKPSSSIGITLEANSYAIETTIGGEDDSCAEECIYDIKEKILSVKNLAFDLAQARINLAVETASSVVKKKEEYASLRNEFNKQYKEALELIKKSGVMVFTWSTGSEQSGSIGLGKLFGTSQSQSKLQSGFAVVSGLKISQLYVGSDIGNTWGGLNRSSGFSNRFEVTTYNLQAQYITYMAESEWSASTKFDFEAAAELLSNSGTLSERLGSIEIKQALAKTSSLMNMGVTGLSKREKVIVDWEKPFKKPIGCLNGSNGSDFNTNNGWQTIYAVKSDLKDILSMRKKLIGSE